MTVVSHEEEFQPSTRRTTGHTWRVAAVWSTNSHIHRSFIFEYQVDAVELGHCSPHVNVTITLAVATSTPAHARFNLRVFPDREAGLVRTNEAC